MGDGIPLEHQEFYLPPTSTIYKKTLTNVCYCNVDKMELNETVLKQLKEISVKVANQKEMIVCQSWHYFFFNVLQDISDNHNLSQLLFETQEEFYQEEALYRHFNKGIF